jgi:DNA-directed RNA polymerase subunit RPC12/RpoP
MLATAHLNFTHNPADMHCSEMQCPHCSSGDIWRLRRRRLRDSLLSYFNRWPYICHQCEKRFWADARWPVRNQPAPAQPPVRQTYAAPSAIIEVRAETQQQLDQMLLSLNQAISQFQKVPKDAAPETQPPVHRYKA